MSSDLKYVLLFVVVFSVTFVVGSAAVQLVPMAWRAWKRRAVGKARGERRES